MGLSAGEAGAVPAVVVVPDWVVVDGVDIHPTIAMTAHVVMQAILAIRARPNLRRRSLAPMPRSSLDGVILIGAYGRERLDRTESARLPPTHAK
jgi:hypothetical protein